MTINDDSYMKFGWSRLSVCEFLRQIYVKTDDDFIKSQCQEGTLIAKQTAKSISRLLNNNHWGAMLYPKIKDPNDRRLENCVPSTIEEMNCNYDDKTIYNILSKIYYGTNDNDIQLICRRAMTMAKKWNL